MRGTRRYRLSAVSTMPEPRSHVRSKWDMEDRRSSGRPTGRARQKQLTLFDKCDRIWFLFTNHVGIDEHGEYTDAIASVYLPCRATRTGSRSSTMLLTEQPLPREKEHWTSMVEAARSFLQIGTKYAPMQHHDTSQDSIESRSQRSLIIYATAYTNADRTC